jgi:predicted acyltransferase
MAYFNRTHPHDGRLVSLDVFRGLSIGGMILVNNQGNWNHVYEALRHASWHGWSGADIVFPFFLFAMGASLFFAHTSRLRDGISKANIFSTVLLRTFLLFSLGLFLNFFPEFEIRNLRIPGVLQRIAVCYFFSSVLFLFASNRLRIILTVLLLFAYGALLLFVTPIGFGSGSLDPCCNLPGYVDKLLFPGHTYELAPVQGFDPEGLLSTAPALCSAMIGVIAAGLLRTGGNGFPHIARIAAGGAGLMLLGQILGVIIPINKNLWTPSYCLFMGGMAVLLFSFLHWIYDARDFRFMFLPFVVLGRNAIAVYLLSSLAGKALISIPVGSGSGTTVKALLYRQVSVEWMDPGAASLVYSILFLLTWLGIMYLLYRKRIFISI